VQPSQVISPPADIRGRGRRKYAGRQLADIMTEMMFASSNYQRTLFQALLDAKKIHGRKKLIVEDIERKPLNYSQLISRCFVLGKKIEAFSYEDENIGVLLPGSVNTVAVFMGLHAFGRVPAMLNYTIGADGMIKACETAHIKNIITSRRFIQLAKLDSAADELSKAAKLHYLEDLAKTVLLFDKIKGLIASRFAEFNYRRYAENNIADDPAVVLFTSGSEGTPKGVVLSHSNLLANREQLAARVDFSGQDIILNALPMFHSFGLTAGTLLPLLSGMKAFYYPSPLHYRVVPEISYDINATILFGTNTFLAGYARFAHPYDFYSVRYVFAGAEKLQEETRRIWSDKFGVRIFEGYGATETSPVLAINTPMDNEPGSVGRFIPGIEYRLEDVPGVEQGGRLYVSGPNIMSGYFLHDNPAVLVPPVCQYGKGWYDTGDIVTINLDGFIRISGRAKRFAKIGGEMVSLAAAEELANAIWPNEQHAVVSVPDPQKGEQLVLLTTRSNAIRTELQAYAKECRVGEINVPRKIIITDKMPLLGTGKLDYPGVSRFVEQEMAT
jgi:acyl-[acyl-carrier-protein]-phospholipid O-acyltransferase/long-chain-fatty-acid--[acyl-carrier-protein] ligase